MKCPGCATEISDAHDRCSVCDFTLADLDAQARAVLPEARPAGDVYDPGRAVSRGGLARIQERIDAFEERVEAEFRVVVVPSVKPLSASEAAFWLFNRWDLGGEKNRGVLLLLALEDRSVQFEVGYTLEPFVTDDESWRVLDRHVVPLLRRAAVDEALYHGIDLVAELIETAEADDRRPAERGA